VHDVNVALASKLSANALYLMNLRDKLPPKGQVLLTMPSLNGWHGENA
jgi:hypothetical protein